MKKSEYPIVVIDEDPDQLSEMQDACQKAGYECTTILYDPLYSQKGEPYSGIQLLFLDMNLNPGPGQNDKVICSVLENAITSYISRDNGPFVMVFWTSRKDLVTGFKSFLDRYQDKNRAIFSIRPVHFELLSKEDFIAQPQKSLEAIMRLPVVKLVFSLEESLQNASRLAFKDILACVNPAERWGDNDTYVEELKKVFTKIAVCSVGKDIAPLCPDKAIMDIVGEEVKHHLINNAGNVWKDFLGIDGAIAKDAKNTRNKEWQHKLNSVFHLEQGGVNTDRGAVLTGKRCKFELFIGKSISNWYNEEFSFVKDDKDKSEYLPVAVEISPACDYAQGNTRLYRYILGVCRISNNKPSNSIEDGQTPPFKQKQNHYVLPTFFIGEKYYKIALAFKYVIGLRECFADRLNYLFTLRGSMVTKICSDVSDYSSRIGIININEA